MGLLADLRQVRRGFHRGGPRPRSWPAAEDAVPERFSDLGWARTEPVRSLRFLIQRGLMMPFTEAMTHPQIEGEEWTRELDRPHLLVANHVSHADTPLLLHALSQHTRERTVVAAAEDYFYERRWLGYLMGIWLNTFPFSRTGGAQAVLSSSSQLLKSGWNLLMFPEGTRSRDGSMTDFKPGIGHLAVQNRTPVIPMHVRGSHRVMAKGSRFPLPAPVKIRIGKPLTPGREETSKAFAVRIESAVRGLAEGSDSPELTGNWIDRWRATQPRSRSSE